MNDELAQQIAHAFNRQAARFRVRTMTSMTEAAIRRGRTLRRRRQVGAAAATAAVIAVAVPAINLALSADGSTRHSSTPGGTSSTSPVSPTPTQTAESPSRPATTPCSEVTAPPPNTKVETVLNNETGILQFFYTVSGKNYAYTIDFRNDPTCQGDPALRRLIQHAIETWQQATSDEETSPTPAGLEGPPVDDAELVSGQLGWFRSGSMIQVTTDRGDHWRRLALPAEPISGHAVSLTDQQITAVGLQEGHLHLFKSPINSANWQDAADLGEVRGAGSADLETTTRGPAGVLVTLESSTAFSVGLYFGTTDGQAWSRRNAPSGGDLTLSPDGRTAWIAGGAINDELYRSTDNGKTWDRVKLPVNDLPVGGTVAISPPGVTADGDTVIPVTTHAPDETTTVRFMVTHDDGATFTQAANVPLDATTSDGVQIPTAVHADTWIILDSAANRLYTLPAGGGQPKVVSPNGLLPGVTSISFSTATTGWATVDYIVCMNGKGNCSEYNLLFETNDSGQTWARIKTS